MLMGRVMVPLTISGRLIFPFPPFTYFPFLHSMSIPQSLFRGFMERKRKRRKKRKIGSSSFALSLLFLLNLLVLHEFRKTALMPSSSLPSPLRFIVSLPLWKEYWGWEKTGIMSAEGSLHLRPYHLVLASMELLDTFILSGCQSV